MEGSGRAESPLGAGVAGEKKYADAEPLRIEGYDVGAEGPHSSPGRVSSGRTHQWIVELYQAWGKPEKAAEWKKK